MSEEQEKLSPEEKLLRVIQGDDKPKKDEPKAVPIVTGKALEKPVTSTELVGEGVAAVAGKAETTDETAQVAVASEENKPGLKLAEPGKVGGAASTRKKKPAGTSVMPKSRAVRAKPSVATTSDPELVFGVGAVNKCLAAAITIVLVLTGIEIWGNVRASSRMPVAADIEMPDMTVDQAGASLPVLEDVLAKFAERPVFQPMVAPSETARPGQGRDIIKESCSWLGLSRDPGTGEQEVIVMDNVRHKMHILKQGASCTVDGVVFEVLEIQSDKVIFTDGQRKSVLE